MPKSDFSFPSLDPQSLPGPESIHRWELPNGITLLARENFASPSVVVSGLLPAGSLFDDVKMAGTAHLTAMGLLRGTETRTAQEIFEAVESIGARLSFSAGVHSTAIRIKCLAGDLDTLLDLLGEVLSSATFPEVEFSRLKSQHLTALAIRAQDISAQAHLLFDDIVYKDHPYRIPSDGYTETVEPITTTDVKRFHHKYYQPQGVILSVVGGIEATQAYEAVNRTLGRWSVSSTIDQETLPELQPLQEEISRSVRLPGKVQSDLLVGSAGPSRYDPDFLAAALGNHILGRFGLMGRIGESVREKAGLAYYAYSSVSGGIGPGPWQVIAGINPANEERALALIKSEITRFVSEKVTEQEIWESQANIIGRLPLQLESNEGVAGSITHVERYGLGLDYYQRYPELISAISREHILETAKRFFDPDQLAIAIAGP